MKKGLNKFSLLFTLTLLSGCFGETHEHTFSTDWSFNNEKHWHAATCEHTDLKTDENDHQFGEWRIKTAATFETIGIEHRTCECGAEETRDIPRLTHNFSEDWEFDSNNHFHSCTDEGYETIKIDEEPHQMGELIVDTPATFEFAGIGHKECLFCDYKEENILIEKLVHKYSTDWTYDSEKHWHSCTDEGYETIKTDEEPHQMGELIIDTPATFEFAGIGHKECLFCDYKEENILIEKLVHKYSTDWTYDSEKHWHSCTDEGYSYLKIDEEAHKDDDHDDLCDICNTMLIEESLYASKKFNKLANEICTNHNYRLEISSEVEGWEEIDNYYDHIVNINNKVMQFDDSEYGLDGAGYIYQKDQGYVKFLRSGDAIVPSYFISTNPEIGITDFNDVVIENIVSASFTQDTQDVTKFTTTSEDAIAVGCNMSGFAFYISAGMLQSDTKLDAYVDYKNETITIKMNYWLMYFDVVEHLDKALLTITIKDIGKTSDVALESYIENPTKTYIDPEAWSDIDKEAFVARFNSVSPVFPTGLSYAYTVDLDFYDGFEYAYLTDKASGDLRESYEEQLLSDGYSKIGEYAYKKIVSGTQQYETDTYSVIMLYSEPTTQYPNGVMKILYRHRNDLGVFIDISEFNLYLKTKGYDELVPELPIEETCTGITNVKDTTASSPDIYALKMNSTDTFKVKIPSFDKAKAFADAYSKLLIAKGYSSKSSFLSGTNYSLASSVVGSYVCIDVAKTSGEYVGYVGLRFIVYKADETTLRGK